MKLLEDSKKDLFERYEYTTRVEGTNRILEFPFRMKIKNVLHRVFVDVMITVEDGKDFFEFDIVDDFYTQDQKDGIENLLNKELC